MKELGGSGRPVNPNMGKGLKAVARGHRACRAMPRDDGIPARILRVLQPVMASGNVVDLEGEAFERAGHLAEGERRKAPAHAASRSTRDRLAYGVPGCLTVRQAQSVRRKPSQIATKAILRHRASLVQGLALGCEVRDRREGHHIASLLRRFEHGGEGEVPGRGWPVQCHAQESAINDATIRRPAYKIMQPACPRTTRGGRSRPLKCVKKGEFRLSRLASYAPPLSW